MSHIERSFRTTFAVGYVDQVNCYEFVQLLPGLDMSPPTVVRADDRPMQMLSYTLSSCFRKI